MSKSQEAEEIDRAVTGINHLHGEITAGRDREGLLARLLALSVHGGDLRDAAVGWYVALMSQEDEEG